MLDRHIVPKQPESKGIFFAARGLLECSPDADDTQRDKVHEGGLYHCLLEGHCVPTFCDGGEG